MTGVQTCALPISPVAQQKNLYFGLVVKNSADVKEVIPFFDQRREDSVEYDITKCIYRVANPKQIKIGIYSPLPVQGEMPSPMMMSGPQSQPWAIYTLLQGFYNVEALTVDDLKTVNDKDIDVLILIHPKKIGDVAEYAVEQFILKGKRAIIFTDPYCVSDPPRPDPAKGDDQFFQYTYRSDSTVDHLFAMLNIDRVALPNEADERPQSDKPTFIADRLNAYTHNGVEMLQTVFFRRLPDEDPKERLAGDPAAPNAADEKAKKRKPDAREKTISTTEFVVSDVKDIKLLTPGAIQPESGAMTQFIPLFQTSSASMPMPTDKIKFIQKVEQLLDGFKPTGERYTVGAWIRGKAQSVFPQGRPDAPTDEEKLKNHIAESRQGVNVIVIADVDMLSDQLTGSMMNFFGRQMFNPSSENSNFLLNAIDALSGSNDLISVRARSRYSRPFTRVEDLERAAMDDYREKYKGLEEQKAETQRKIDELQKGKDESQVAILTPEQRVAIDEYNATLKSIRDEMRQILNKRDAKIKRLGSTLKVLLIAVWPGLIGLGAAAFGLIRHFRRQST